MGDCFLFVTPSFISGMGRVLDLGSTLNEYNTSITPEMADYRAVKSDWAITGADLVRGISEFDGLSQDGQE